MLTDDAIHLDARHPFGGGRWRDESDFRGVEIDDPPA